MNREKGGNVKSQRKTHHGAPFLQALTTLDHLQHQLYLKSTQEMAHQPAQFMYK